LIDSKKKTTHKQQVTNIFLIIVKVSKWQTKTNKH
jgi:hypothetical protein